MNEFEVGQEVKLLEDIDYDEFLVTEGSMGVVAELETRGAWVNFDNDLYWCRYEDLEAIVNA